MTTTNRDVSVRLRAKNELPRGVRGAMRTLDALERRASRLGRAMGRAAREGADRLADSFRRLGQIAGVAFLAASAGALRLADRFTSLQNLLRLVTKDEQDLVNTTADLAGIANRTRAPLDAVVSLFQKGSIAAKELNASQEDLLRFTENVGLALAQQAGGTEKARGALLQLSQAIGQDIVRAEEFNSILEGAYPVAIAAANGIDRAGGSVARLRRLIIAGEVTSKEFFQALLSQSDALEEAFAKTTPTIGQAMTVAMNRLTVAASKLTPITGRIAQGILDVTANLDDVVLVIERFVDRGGRVVGMMRDWVAENWEWLAIMGTVLATMGLLSAAAGLLTNPLTWVLAGTVALTLGLKKLEESGVDVVGFLKDIGIELRALLPHIDSFIAGIDVVTAALKVWWTMDKGKLDFWALIELSGAKAKFKEVREEAEKTRNEIRNNPRMEDLMVGLANFGAQTVLPEDSIEDVARRWVERFVQGVKDYIGLSNREREIQIALASLAGAPLHSGGWDPGTAAPVDTSGTTIFRADQAEQQVATIEDHWNRLPQIQRGIGDVLLAGNDALWQSIIDTDISGQERREQIWQAMKVSFANVLADMMSAFLKSGLLRLFGAIFGGVPALPFGTITTLGPPGVALRQAAPSEPRRSLPPTPQRRGAGGGGLNVTLNVNVSGPTFLKDRTSMKDLGEALVDTMTPDLERIARQAGGVPGLAS